MFRERSARVEIPVEEPSSWGKHIPFDCQDVSFFQAVAACFVLAFESCGMLAESLSDLSYTIKVHQYW